MDLNNMDYYEKLKLAKDPNTHKDTLRDLAKGDEGGVMYYVARNPQSSSKLLVSILENEKYNKIPRLAVIRALYHNPKLPYIAKVIIETLFGDML